MPLSTSFKVYAAIACTIAAIILAFADFETFVFFGFPLIAGCVGSVILNRQDPRRAEADQITDALRIYFGLHLIWTSVRYWMTDMQPVITDPLAGPFLDSLSAIGIFPAIKTLEGIVGVMLLLNRYVPLALVLEMPASTTIFYLNTFITGHPRQLMTGPAEIGVNLLLLLAYFQYYRPFLVPHALAAPPRFLGLRAAPNCLDAIDALDDGRAGRNR